MARAPSVLIVDDHIDSARMLARILERKGYSVATAVDGHKAIERVKESPFDLTFMDVKMPGMNGLETYRRIKEIRPEAVVVMMTAYDVDDLIRTAIVEGAHGAIYKPLDIQEVLALVERAAKEVASG
jgi:CheY-like chemotaxis protein